MAVSDDALFLLFFPFLLVGLVWPLVLLVARATAVTLESCNVALVAC